jgi:hypothetical protein
MIDALLEQEAGASMWRNTQKENRIDNRRRFLTGDAPDFVEVGEAGIAVDEGYAASAFCSTRWVTYLD